MSGTTTDTKRIIRVMTVPRNEGVPQKVLEALKGLEIPILFTGEQILKMRGKDGLIELGINRGDCVASVEEVMFALQEAKKENEVLELSEASKSIKCGLTFEAGCFRRLF